MSEIIPITGKSVKLFKGHYTRVVLDKKGEGELYRTELAGNRVLVRLPGIPDVGDIAPNGDPHLTEKFRSFLSKKMISSRSALVSYLLGVTPDGLSFLDDPLITIGKVVSLHLKGVLVPNDANAAYDIRVNEKLTGYLVSGSQHDHSISFVHLFDHADHHYQLVCFVFRGKGHRMHVK